jgi:V/A-type H+-transporting ATPase subunit E
MHNKLQEITEKIYQEGVSRGNEEAEKIIAGARTEAEEIIGKAEKEAKEIVAEARRKADEMTKKTGSELRLTFRNAMNSLKQEIEKTIISKVVDEPVSDVFSDSRFVAGLIEIIAGKWSPENSEKGIEIYLPEETFEDINNYLTGKTKKILSEGIILRPVKSLEKGFEIHPSGAEYKISVTDSDFTSYIKEFIRPGLAELLFEKNQ